MELSNPEEESDQPPATRKGAAKISRFLDLYGKWPSALDAMFADDDGMNKEPVLDYITDLETRRGIFLELQRLLKLRDDSAELRAISLGIVMVAPIDKLQYHLDKMRRDEGSANYSIFTMLDTTAISAIRAFVVKGGPPPRGSVLTSQNLGATDASSIGEGPSKRRRGSNGASRAKPSIPALSAIIPTISERPPPPPPETPKKRPREDPTGNTSSAMEVLPHLASSSQLPSLSPVSKDSKASSRKRKGPNHCKIRDSNQCVLTGTQNAEAAHIFPHSTTDKQNFLALKDMLRMFWGEEKAAIWSKLFEDEVITESPQNLICLNRQLHWWFDNAMLALKPLRRETNSVTVQFHWLKGNNFKPHIALNKWRQRNTFDDVMSRAGLLDNQAWGQALYCRISGLPLETGQTFVIRAENPDHVPSFELLELSWDLLRVAAICGAAEPTDDWLRDDDDDGDGVGVRPGFSGWEENQYGQWRRWAEEVEPGSEEEPEQHNPEDNVKHPS
ncbi:hypothetical protein QBC33DRAFT_571807 [Phialemonium atrogriseum]|uniref:HNH nuclease domain-containing protein n=1 Tax=Phialemonium atrogriseum TaxID=1093897 RepID=A0AAJ0BVV3_9PEZI|nr:uncharacterized protein QBC33DRAFT_571807 [Phialemonium atrogriseum]KAK1765250.1 hypothetical protein QBC33DRAFT_571807 [Phialemonium atrogriseum]